MSDRVRPLVPPRNYEGKKDRGTSLDRLKKQGCDSELVRRMNRND